MDAPPLMTFGVPTFNRAAFLPETLDSLLSQSYGNVEVVVSDNASTDDTPLIMAEYVRRDPRVRYYRNDTNKGIIDNFNRVFELAHGEYFAWAGDDDVYDRNFASTLITVLEGDRSCALAASSADWIDERGQPTSGPSHDYFTSRTASRLTEALRALRHARGNLVMGVIRAETLRQTMLFDHTARNLIEFADLRLLFDLSLRGDLYWTPEVLIHKRRGGYSWQAAHRPLWLAVALLLNAGRKYMQRLSRSPVVGRDRLLLRLAILWHVLLIVWRSRQVLAKAAAYSVLPPALRARILERRSARRLRSSSSQ